MADGAKKKRRAGQRENADRPDLATPTKMEATQ